jgi:putative flippase GtrA
MSLIHDSNERTKFFRFAIVGAIGAVIDFGIFNLLATLIGIPAVWASVVSFSLAVINNFAWNRLWTFPETRSTPVMKQLTQFTIVSLAGLAIRTPLFAYLEKLLIPLAEKYIPNLLTPTIVGHNTALAIVILVVMLWNFFINRLWTFKRPMDRSGENREPSSTA